MCVVRLVVFRTVYMYYIATDPLVDIVTYYSQSGIRVIPDLDLLFLCFTSDSRNDEYSISFSLSQTMIVMCVRLSCSWSYTYMNADHCTSLMFDSYGP